MSPIYRFAAFLFTRYLEIPFCKRFAQFSNLTDSTILV